MAKAHCNTCRCSSAGVRENGDCAGFLVQKDTNGPTCICYTCGLEVAWDDQDAAARFGRHKPLKESVGAA